MISSTLSSSPSSLGPGAFFLQATPPGAGRGSPAATPLSIQLLGLVEALVGTSQPPPFPGPCNPIQAVVVVPGCRVLVQKVCVLGAPPSAKVLDLHDLHAKPRLRSGSDRLHSQRIGQKDVTIQTQECLDPNAVTWGLITDRFLTSAAEQSSPNSRDCLIISQGAEFSSS